MNLVLIVTVTIFSLVCSSQVNDQEDLDDGKQVEVSLPGEVSLPENAEKESKNTRLFKFLENWLPIRYVEAIQGRDSNGRKQLKWQSFSDVCNIDAIQEYVNTRDLEARRNLIRSLFTDDVTIDNLHACYKLLQTTDERENLEALLPWIENTDPYEYISEEDIPEVQNIIKEWFNPEEPIKYIFDNTNNNNNHFSGFDSWLDVTSVPIQQYFDRIVDRVTSGQRPSGYGGNNIPHPLIPSGYDGDNYNPSPNPESGYGGSHPPPTVGGSFAPHQPQRPQSSSYGSFRPPQPQRPPSTSYGSSRPPQPQRPPSTSYGSSRPPQPQRPPSTSYGSSRPPQPQRPPSSGYGSSRPQHSQRPHLTGSGFYDPNQEIHGNRPHPLLGPVEYDPNGRSESEILSVLTKNEQPKMEVKSAESSVVEPAESSVILPSMVERLLKKIKNKVDDIEVNSVGEKADEKIQSLKSIEKSLKSLSEILRSSTEHRIKVHVVNSDSEDEVSQVE